MAANDIALIDQTHQTDYASHLANRLGASLHTTPPAEAEFLLWLTASGLAIQPNQPDAPAPLQVDFVTGKAAWRRGQGELIVKAVKLRGKSGVTVLDATAGLGRDGFVLASHGFKVVLLERDPVIHALLEDGLKRASTDEDIRTSTDCIELHHADLLDWQPTERPEVVYLDPMFPQRQKSAKVKKEMVIFQQLLDPTVDEEQLLNRALQLAGVKVVVKRPIKAAALAGRRPTAQIKGRSIRFDIYPATR